MASFRHLVAAVALAQTLAELACETHPDCASCSADPPCGWCTGRHQRVEGDRLIEVLTAHCTEGTESGPLPFTQVCEHFQFHSSACAPEMNVARPCESYQTCGECVADESCGFCEETQRCTATCEGCAFYHTDICPGGTDCGQYKRAFNCVRDQRCGYCDDDGLCREGGLDGPTDGKARCSKWHSLSRWFYNASYAPGARAAAAAAAREAPWATPSAQYYRYDPARLRRELRALLPPGTLEQQQAAEHTHDIGGGRLEARAAAHRRFAALAAQEPPAAALQGALRYGATRPPKPRAPSD